ncbi:MAG: pro-sigmaK processing inhibitor BofA family protein [Syntrophomonadaceae bacterium]|nr:pro-sigmaK processing inhibitor BofA family protein [Syntrophomonadaceae bacterium]
MPAQMVDFLIAALFALFLIMLLGKVLLTPIRWAFKLLLNSAVGLFILLVINYIGAPWGFSMHINLVTVLTAGILGLPGIILLAVLELML